ncbi:hol1 protein (member of major facilitator superfamily) [Pleurostoma richardsiae]|uniref:Hol1 protein (Member of major facilitator superfamily) n=1 Tax=Pleurostoma richardsiae TaxID=41990 RepID=A0AA38RRI0_9PEZI|nr:hol1 protein (member of major facilitator superfamily) [Pleurostoma richardsiae]
MTDGHKCRASRAEDVEDAKSASNEPSEFMEVAKPAHEHIEGDALLVDRRGHIRRLPVPSQNPNDPLNFKIWEKTAIIICCCWFSLLSLALAAGLGPFLSVFVEMYTPHGYDSNHIAFLLTIPNLAIGLGNYIILPVSLAIGRRPVFLVSTVILLVATIGSAVQNDYKSHLATRTIQGLATGASESLLPLMLTEVTFLHQRGQVFGLYWMVQSVFSGLLNLSSSYINSSLGWRWYYWIFSIAIGVGLVLAVFCAFETRFSRPATSIDGTVIITDEFGVTHVLPDDEAQEYLEQIGTQAQSDTADVDTARTTYLQKIKPWSKPHAKPLRMIALSWARMAQCLTSPAILYVVLISSITLGCVVDMSLTYDVVLQGKGWAPKDIGLINLGAVIGAIIGSIYSTLLGERFMVFMARRNQGVHKPEHRLIVLVVPALLAVAMLLTYGFAASGDASWWGPVLAYTFYNAAWVTVLIVSTTFASEATPKHPGPALVMVVGTKNIVSFGFTYGLNPLVAKGGYSYAFGVLAGVLGACFILGVPVYLLNPKWRSYTGRMEKRRGVVSTD